MVQIINQQSFASRPNIDINKEGVKKTIAKSSQVVSDSFEENSAVKTISATAGDGGFAKAAPLVPILYVADKAIDSAMGGNPETNILGKIAKLGDKISDALHLDRFISAEKITNFKNKIKNNRFTKYFTKSYKANPICSMAKPNTLADTLGSKLDDQAQKILPRILELNETTDVITNLRSTAGVKPETISLINDVVNGAEKTFGTKEILNAVDDMAANGVNIADKSLSVIRNKHAAATSQLGKSTLGKLFSKGTVKTKDVITYGGGLISLFFMASSLANAIKATKEAPKGEKKATFMHVLSEQYLGMILFQPSINLVYKMAGNKYRGMTESGRKALADLVKNTSVDETLTKEAIKVAKLQKKLLLKGVDESKVATLAGKGLNEAKNIAKSLSKDGAKLKFWEKPLKFLGSILGTGLDKLKSPKFANIGGKKIKIPQPTFKGFLGGFARFALIMFVIQPMLQKPLTKLCHKIFGKPKSYLEKQNAKNNPNSQTQGVQPAGYPSYTQQTGETNLLKLYSQNPVSDIPSVPVVQGVNQVMPARNLSDVQPIRPREQAYIASSSITEQQPQSRYIPASSISAQPTRDRYIPNVANPYVAVDDSKQLEKRVAAILKHSDSAVKNAKKSLN